MTNQGGNESGCACGTVYQLTPATTTAYWTFKRIHAFDSNDGEYPVGNGLVVDSAGNLYGLTLFGGLRGVGVVFELSPTAGGGWKESVLHSFTGGYDGELPHSSLAFDPAGNLWGTTSGGGSHSAGGVFELSPVAGGQWSFAGVYVFQGGSDGEFPDGSLIFDASGNVYGTTETGGNATTPRGTVFELSPSSGVQK
jgi:uncharacterized repeat protein (TIGR03803 family)